MYLHRGFEGKKRDDVNKCILKWTLEPQTIFVGNSLSCFKLVLHCLM